MGIIQQPQPVCPICAVCSGEESRLLQVLKEIQELLGNLQSRSAVIDFNFTTYYQEEMGGNLLKVYAAFADLTDPGLLPQWKHRTNEIESRYMINDKRTVNIDPGYIEAAKLVLASTKNFSHRIYIGQGIYGDLQLTWRKGGFQANPCTYPDYRDERVLSFFNSVRNDYWTKLRKGIS
ncbi:MAG: DUF4416 family protein [candidate division KSB1 bacterium]|nr:DUF4416 family protein [candidate division KSB1 bacterium]